MSNGDSQIIDFTVGDRVNIAKIATAVEKIANKQAWFERTAIGSLLTALIAVTIAFLKGN